MRPLHAAAILLFMLGFGSLSQSSLGLQTSQQGSRPNPDAAGHHHVGDGVTSPKVTYVVDPEYTDEARRKRIRGSCDLTLTVNVDGTTRDVSVAHSLAEGLPKKLQSAARSLDESAI